VSREKETLGIGVDAPRLVSRVDLTVALLEPVQLALPAAGLGRTPRRDREPAAEDRLANETHHALLQSVGHRR
jgi:hypothetical protein